MSEVKWYYLTRNRDHERVLAEITPQAKRFLRIKEDEYVRASDYVEAAALIASQAAEIEHLRARLAEAEQDAARYRFLRLKRPDDWKLMPAATLDAAIDAAMAAASASAVPPELWDLPTCGCPAYCKATNACQNEPICTSDNAG
jgi:hypothetical protein